MRSVRGGCRSRCGCESCDFIENDTASAFCRIVVGTTPPAPETCRDLESPEESIDASPHTELAAADTDNAARHDRSGHLVCSSIVYVALYFAAREWPAHE